MKNLLYHFVAGLLVFLFISLLNYGSYAEERGISPNLVRIGSYAPLTGSASYAMKSVLSAKAFFEDVNQRGGVHGRKIEFIIQDDKYFPETTKAVVRNLVEEKKVFAIVGGYGTSTGLEVIPYIEQKKVLDIAPISLCYRFAYKTRSEYTSKYIFSLFTHYSTQAKLLIKYAVEHLKAKKIAIIYPENEFGKEGVDSLLFQLKKYRMEPSAIVPHEPILKDFTTKIDELRKSNSDYVVLWDIPANAALAVKAAETIQWTPRWLGNSSLLDRSMIEVSGKNWNNAVVPSILPLPDSPDPGNKKFREIMEKNNLPIDFLTQAGFAAGEVFVEGLKRTGRDLNQNNFIKAMESIKNWNGLILHDVSYSQQRRQGMTSVFFAKSTDGKYVKVTEWMTIINGENGPPPR